LSDARRAKETDAGAGSERRRRRPRTWIVRLVAPLAILGPGLIAANASNDAGGVAAYASVGARYGYDLLWVIVLITLSLIVVQEMAGRMGIVTGKGFAEVVREHYGVRWTTVVMLSILITNLAIGISEFVGIAAASELLHVPREVAVPLAAVLVWTILVRGSYRWAERIFIAMTIPFFAYPIAAVLAHPHWADVGHAIVKPQLHTSPRYVYLVVAIVGATVMPFMQLYLQSAVAERGVRVEGLGRQRLDIVGGVVFANLIAGFIIISTAAALFTHGITNVDSAADAARALEPFAGRFAKELFAIGLLGASLLAAAILPVTTAYVISESFGMEKGVGRHFREAPVFTTTITALIGTGAIVALIPGLPVIALLVGVQGLNGVFAPITLFFLWRLSRNRELMGEWRSGRLLSAVAGATVIAMTILSFVLLVATVTNPGGL
jgi:NRAMP (natural resistance-associated macrophage protein)-like metal ion transporter